MSLDQRRKSFSTTKFLRRGKPIKQQSPRSIKYEDFRKLKLVKDRDEEGLIHCQDHLIGLPACGIAIPTPDLHHTQGRDGELLFDEPKMVWLTRECHNTAHNTRSSRAEAKDDPQRPLEATPQRDAILGVQGRSTQRDSRDTRPKIYGSVQSLHANVVVREEKDRV